MRIEQVSWLLFIVLFLALVSLPPLTVVYNFVDADAVFSGPAPVLIASLVYCTVVGIGKVMLHD